MGALNRKKEKDKDEEAFNIKKREEAKTRKAFSVPR